MRTRVARWGNSLAVRLPAEVVREFGLAEGQMLELRTRRPIIEMSAPTAERRYLNGIPVYTLAELVAGMDPANEPETISWGPDRGSECISDGYSRGEFPMDDPLAGRTPESG